jgi:hypothetical protein
MSDEEWPDEEWPDEMEDAEDKVEQPMLIHKNSLNDPYKVIKQSEMRGAFEKKIEQWIELYFLDFDSMVIVARYFEWQDYKMNQWFEMMDELETKIGLKPNKASMAKKSPIGFCESCYEEFEI